MTGPSPAGASPAAGNDSLPVPPPAEISEEEIDKHARGRVLIKLLRLREQYGKVFKNDYEYVLQQAAEAVGEFAASNREAYTTGRNAILEIGGYQAWDGVLQHPYYSDELYDRTSIFAIFCIVGGSVGFAIDYSVTGHGIWWVILLALIVIGASFCPLPGRLPSDATHRLFAQALAKAV